MKSTKTLFEEHATRAFAFLEQELGYRRRSPEGGSLRFETANVFVLVAYDMHRSHELTVMLGQRLTTPDPAFDLGEILRAVEAPNDIPSAYQTDEAEAMKSFLDDMARTLRTYGLPLLLNVPDAFAQLTRLREKECRQYALARIRSDAEAAWSKKDYPTVVRTLGPIRSCLSAGEVGKLEFAEKQCGR